MKIFLNEKELEKAVHDYVDSVGVKLPPVTQVELKAGRGNNGHTASVAFGDDISSEFSTFMDPDPADTQESEDSEDSVGNAASASAENSLFPDARSA